VIIGEASNGRQAIEQYDELQPDVVTMDISMPIMSGVEAVQRIITKYPEAKIVMISAVNQKKMVFNAINSGAKHYIIKPIESKKVLCVINEVIGMVYALDHEDVQEEMNSEQGFEINNVQGRFVIRFNKALDRSDLNLLKMAVDGILFIKPLKVEFNFEELLEVDDAILAPILKLAENIETSDGTVTYSATTPGVVERLPG